MKNLKKSGERRWVNVGQTKYRKRRRIHQRLLPIEETIRTCK